jgi:MraZ protein
MFRGNHPTRIDDKGRLKVPADFKREIEEKFSNQQFYCTSFSGKDARVYPMEEWERVEAKLAALPSLNPTRQKLLNVSNYYGQVVEMDGQGRVTIPGLLRDAADIKGEVAVMGFLQYLVVRNADQLKQEIESAPFTAEDEKTLSDLGI